MSIARSLLLRRLICCPVSRPSLAQQRPFALAKGDCDCGDGDGKKSRGDGPPFPIEPGYLKLKQKQAEYSRDDGKPIWLKRPTDSLLVGITWSILLIAVGMQFQMVYELSMPKK